jgi:ribose transport system permease protein
MPVPIVDTAFVQVLAGSVPLGVPVPIWWTLATVLVGFYLLHMSLFGRRALATGGNSTAARFSGINTDRVRIAAFALSGGTAAMAGLVLAARSAAGNPILGLGLELDVIAAVIIGGTSLFGGRGSVWGTLLGALIVGVFRNGLSLAGLDVLYQTLAVGVLIILAVSIDQWIRKVKS